MHHEKLKTGCEAPIHNQDCPCNSCTLRQCATCPLLTKDHFTPKCIALKVFGWRRKQVNSRDNIQWLSRPCHQDKDATTPLRYEQTNLQVKLRGTIRFGEHIT